MPTNAATRDLVSRHDLAPEIYRQRLVIEGLVTRSISGEEITAYLDDLSGCLGMVTILPPVTHRSTAYGWAGWIHWETSGAHFYAWDVPRLFFSVDIYTCKAFSVDAALDLTRIAFAPTHLTYGEF